MIEDEKNLRIVSEYKGTLNDIPLRSIVAVNTSPKVLIGQLSEIHVSITGNSNHYAVEVASNARFGTLAWPDAVGLVIGRPVGLAVGAVGGIVAYEFERKMWKHIQETVKKVSQVHPWIHIIRMRHSTKVFCIILVWL